MDRVVDLRKKEIGQNGSRESKENISWDADYSIYTSASWQKGLVLILSVIIVLFILFKQGFFSVLFFSILLTVFIIQLSKYQKTVPVLLDKNCLKFGKRLVLYKELRSFWISYEPDSLKELSLQHRNWYSTFIKIPIHGQNPIQIRDFLIKYIPEEKHEDSIFDILGRKFGV